MRRGEPDPRGHRAQHQPARRAHARAGWSWPTCRPPPTSTQMIADGTSRSRASARTTRTRPRVGDGFLRVDAAGRVTYASPNALSVYRRLGLTTDLTGLRPRRDHPDAGAAARRPDEETLSAVLGGRAPRDTEIGSDTVLILRAIPLRPTGEHIGALVLLRDVTDLRRRDRELVTKDATIREIHHRVKNNLQTVAALLRLQARRIDVAGGPGGAGGGGAPGRLDRDRARDAQPGLRRARRLRRRRRPAAGDGGRGRLARGAGAPRRGRQLRDAAPPRSRPRWRWCSPSCCRTPSSTGSAEGGGTITRDRASGWSAGCA